jgi:hypothetical protein
MMKKQLTFTHLLGFEGIEVAAQPAPPAQLNQQVGTTDLLS